MPLRIILTTGGTGGHIFPALAVADALKKVRPDVEVLFVGGLYGPEGELARKAGLKFQGLRVRGMLGRGFKSVPAMLAMLRGIWQAWALVRSRKPDAVMGFGGYAAFATVFAARLYGCPTGIHEQNAIPGVTNKVLGKMVQSICLSWPDVNNSFPHAKCMDSGNPIREDIAALGRKRAEKGQMAFAQDEGQAPTLLVMGGSQGARALNSLTISMLSALRDAGVSILHQTGKKDLDRVREAYKSHGYSQTEVERMVVPFINDMAAAYAKADLALCRAGATTLAELAATGTPSILVPFPHAAHDHQTGNARAMQEAKGAILLPESDLERQDVSALCLELLSQPQTLRAMSIGAMTLSRPDAAQAVARRIIELTVGK